MAPSVQQIRRCQTCGPASHHRHLLPGAHLGRLGAGIALLIGIFYDGILILPGGHRLPVQPTGTGRFAQSRTHPGSELRETVGLLQSLVSLFPVPGVNQVVPLRNQIVERAPAGHAAQHHPRLTERHPALHAPRTLKLLLLPGQMLMELIKMPNPLQRPLGLAHFPLIFHKTGGFSHFPHSSMLFF